ncbi:hypothetical protein SS50377_21150 [Spironucleus salmonicida]|uniref:Uncharacterized protein n=1 Tax=Spironucleus salmonicida TaxID=348837 RepID=V6LHB0_9EUKA|nr:hypothetical protein SS50377_21150 [Spironucleus salmonicida]|eukprot:EST43932.1 hypothetical protein SS50377_16234 [Spironucleus salmonicida]
MEGTFRNATGTLQLEEYSNTTKFNHQIPHHDKTYSSVLLETAPRYFNATVAEQIAPVVAQHTYTIQPDISRQYNGYVPTSTSTQPIEPDLATATRRGSILQRLDKTYETKHFKVPEPKHARKYDRKEVDNIVKQLGGQQELKCVKSIQHVIVKVDDKAPVYDKYYHGGHVFDDYTGKHK